MLSATRQDRAAAVLAGAGGLVRTGFYAAGLVVLGLVGIGIALGYEAFPKRVEAAPAFRLAAGDFAARATGGEVEKGWFGRSETRRYGRIHDHDRDLTVILAMPSGRYTAPADFRSEIASIEALRSIRAGILPAYHDLETRFGPLRAAEMRVQADGRRKLCLAFVSRFDTEAVYLKGWVCEANGSKPSPAALACTLNTLALDGRLASAAADGFIRERLSRGSTCHASPVTQTTDTRPPSNRRRW